MKREKNNVTPDPSPIGSTAGEGRISSTSLPLHFNTVSWGMIIVLLPLLLFLGCRQGNENLNSNDFNVISTADEIDMGNRFATQIEDSMPMYTGVDLNRYIDSIGQALVRVNDRQDIPTWTFKIVNDPATVNAFAIPGGHIYVYTGLIRTLDSEAELAAVIGHEISHVAARHGAEQISKEYAAGVIVSFILGDSASALDTLLTNVVTTGVFLKYSRNDELEADSLGTWYEYQAGWNPDTGMIGTLNVLDSIAQAQPISMPEFLSTHPDAASRLEAVHRELDRYRPLTGALRVNRDGYLSHIRGI